MHTEVKVEKLTSGLVIQNYIPTYICDISTRSNFDFPDTTLFKRIPLLQMQCFPLYSLLLALGNPTVNLFILDIEGTEYLILKTIPWDKVDIEVSI
jgi:hypothetical protein